ncbi:hypothetical protein [Streptomyces kebangsaanensis]|uniref:hypothetical protein n=1 Tax=Streptomyces kebangsaanensis TaxID=864058 RepID=UPI000A8D7378|nr:hypothetical protein [Streptomyces kebangsaanensis]
MSTPPAPAPVPPAGPPETGPPAPAAPAPALPAPAATPPQPAGAPAPAPSPTPAPAAPEPDWKAEARKWETRAKENSDAAQRLREIEDAQKTEQQRLAEAKETAEKDAAAARSEALRWRIAARHQISDEDAEIFLTGGDEETLTRQAARLVALRTPPQPSADPPPAVPPTPHTPVEALRPGALPSPPEPTLADRIAAAEREGKWDEARRLKTQQLMQLTQNT